MISYDDAYRMTLERIRALGAEDVPLVLAVGRVTVDDLVGKVDSPSADVSLKDGYAVHSADIAAARDDAPISLRLIGTVAAGGTWQGRIQAGEAVRILSGAPLPEGADAVLAEEFTQLDGETVLAFNDAHPGRNVLL